MGRGGNLKARHRRARYAEDYFVRAVILFGLRLARLCKRAEISYWVVGFDVIRYLCRRLVRPPHRGGKPLTVTDWPARRRRGDADKLLARGCSTVRLALCDGAHGRQIIAAG